MKPVRRKDGRYCLRVQSNGVQKTFYGTTSKECISKAKLWDGKASATTPCKIAMKSWLDTHVATKSKATYCQYETLTRLYINPVIGIIPINKILPINCQQVINKMQKKGLSASSMGHTKKVMHSFFEYERRMKKSIAVNPCIDIVVSKNKTTRDRRSATPEELKMIWEALDGSHYSNCFKFLLLTGLRPSEVCGIKFSDIKGTTITISETRTRYEIGQGKTLNAKRTLNISQGMVDVINNQIAYLNATFEKKPSHLFPNYCGEPSHSGLLTRQWNRTTSHCTDLTCYELRHTFVSLMIDKLPLKELQAFIGHSSRMDTSTTYAHIFDKQNSNSDVIDKTMLEYIKAIN
jgi:integrase